MNTQIIFNGDTIHTETNTNIILHGNSTVKDKLDNFQPVTMSAFGEQLANAPSLAEVCRLMHHNYTFAKDMVDGVEWKIVGNPSADSTHAATGSALHTSNGNYIYRVLNLGSASVRVDFDLFCTDAGKILFRIIDQSTAAANGATRPDYRFSVNSDGFFTAQYYLQTASQKAWPNQGSYEWKNAAVLKSALTLSFKLNSVKSVFLLFNYQDKTLKVGLDGVTVVSSDVNAFPMPNKKYQIRLGNTAEAWIDNFSLTYGSNVFSQLDFD